MVNLTGVPSVYGDLGLAGQNTADLTDEELQKRKKKIMAAGQDNSMATATQFLTGAQMSALGTPRT